MKKNLIHCGEHLKDILLDGCLKESCIEPSEWQQY